KIVDVDGSNDIFDINIRPGIQYDLSSNISILANFGELGYQNTDGDSRFRLRLNAAAIGFGMVYRF
ncbi:MAG: hypothetical protein LBH34_02450, partial [Prevotellaceae bacterium]|nr:hypothetical protein [Prevotellaceae bacterium]